MKKKEITIEAHVEVAPARDTRPSTIDTLALAMFAVEAGLEKKALEPTLLDLRGEQSYTDFILVLSGRSDRHVQNVAEGIVESFAKVLGRRPLGEEGQTDGRWVLIDYGDVVIHVFYHPLREFYDLEGLWCDAPRIELEVPADARASVGTYY